MNRLQQNNILADNDARNKIPLILVAIFVILCTLQILLENILEIKVGFNKVIVYYTIGFPVLLLIVELIKFRPFRITTCSLLLLIIYQSIVALVGILTATNISKISLLGRYLLSITFPIVLYVIIENNFGEKFIDFLFIVNTIMTILFLVLFFSDKAYKFDGAVEGYPLLTLNFNNPNYTAMVLLGNVGVLMLSFWHYKSIVLKTIFAALSIAMFYLLYLANSRLSFGIGIILIVCVLFNFRVRNWHIALIVLMPILFFVLYNYLYSIESLRDVVIMGKPLFSGRNQLWQNVLKTFNQSPVNIIFGNFNTCQLENAHNGALTQLVNYGIVGVILYFGNLYIQIKNIAKNCGKNRAMNSALYIIISSVLLMLAESGPATLGGLINVFVIIAIAYIKFAETNNKGNTKLNSNLSLNEQ